jgi:hypothetical protein
MTNLLILASGAGTRNAMFTYDNALPKCLMSVGNKTCLEAIVDSYDGLVDNVYVAVQTRHRAAVEDLLAFKHYDNVKVISFDQTNNAYASIVAAFKEISDYTEHNWYINWSDVFLKKAQHASKNTIFADIRYHHRNLAVKSGGATQIIHTDDLKGNVPGIFFVHGSDIETIFQLNVMTGGLAFTDFDQCMAVHLTDDDRPIIAYCDDINDIGDYDKYNEYMESIKTDNVCRYFNSIEVNKDNVKKRPITKVGEDLHEIELAYYRTYGSKGTAMAKLLGYDMTTKTMTLERIKGQTCQAFVDARPSDSKLSAVNSLIKKFKTAEELFDFEFNCKDTDEDKKMAAYDEFYTAIERRVKPCVNMITAVLDGNPNIKTIDGMQFSHYSDMMDAVRVWLDKKLAENYFDFGIVHGDPNTDNCLISKGKVRFVDPRGYFGKLKTLGLGVKQYDLAKFVYGFSGYSKFNRSEYIAMTVVDNDLQFYVGSQELQGITDVNLFDMKVDNDIKVLVGIIWVKLTSYIINDPMKSVAAYLYGNALLTKLLNIKPAR